MEEKESFDVSLQCEPRNGVPQNLPKQKTKEKERDKEKGKDKEKEKVKPDEEGYAESSHDGVILSPFLVLFLIMMQGARACGARFLELEGQPRASDGPRGHRDTHVLHSPRKREVLGR